MKAFNKFVLGLCSVALLVACSSSDDYSAGQWNAADGYAKVAFAKTSVKEEVDPSDPCKANFTLTRENTEGELTVPVKILSNTDDVFVVSPATFADGEKEAEMSVTFNNAKVGNPYTLEVVIEGDQYVSFYSSDVKMSYTVTRVKWNRVGYYIDKTTGEKVEGMAMYTDDLVNSFGWSTGTPSYPVPLEERDDKPGVFRLINAYGEYYPWNEDGDYNPDVNGYIVIDATDPANVYIPEVAELPTDWGYGKFLVWSMAGYEMSRNGLAIDEVSEYMGKYENGKITFPAGALLFGCGSGYDAANNAGAFCLVIDPSKDLYKADISKDFKWDLFGEDKELKSELFDTSSTINIYKGTCTTTTDDCDKRFAEEYGTLYRVEAPYAKGHDLYFCVNKKGQVVVPAGYGKQPIGVKALDKDVYASITPESSFEEKVITLIINFTDENGTMDYGTKNEVISLRGVAK